MLDASRDQGPEVRADRQLVDLDAGSDRQVLEVERNARIDGSAEASDRDRLAERLCQPFGHGRADVVRRQHRPGPDEQPG